MAQSQIQSIKCVLVGDGAVGKTSILGRYVSNSFTADYVPTIFDNFSMEMVVNHSQIKLNIWDSAGQEEYANLRKVSYPATNIFIVCFSLASRTTFRNVKDVWKKEIKYYAPNVPFILVGTKADLRDDPSSAVREQDRISTDEAKEMATQLGAMDYRECSSVVPFGIPEIFNAAISVVLNPRKIHKKINCNIL